MPNFFFGSQSAKLFFWQPKPLLAVGTWELVAFILGSIFLAVKSVFGRILPKIKVGSQSAKNKSWQSHCFWHVQIVTHFVWPARQKQATFTKRVRIITLRRTLRRHSDPKHHTTHQHLPSHTTAIMPLMKDGDNDDECNLHHARPNFMPDARDIMNKSPRPNAAASTEIRAFRETFGTSLLIVSKVWSMLWEEDILPEGGHPKHLLWALHFLKVYPLQAPGCAAVGASGGAVDPKTHHKWVWAFIDAIAELVDEVMS